uniref:F-box domain-containing protein n=1 Tax=Caenorhabditis tropicalis TaxID=1561998 RepID=A0A1I7TWT9_9PELO
MFHLFRLPYCAYTVVLNQLEPYELMRLSLCSRSAHRMISAAPRRHGSLGVQVFGRVISIINNKGYLIGIDYSENHPAHVTMINGVAVDPHSLKAYCKNEEDAQKVVDYCTRMFKKEISDVNVFGGPMPSFLPDTIRACIINEELMWFPPEISRFRITSLLHVSSKPHEGFQFPGPLQMNILFVRKGTWLTRELLLSMNCCIVSALGTRLTVEDLKLFIKSWMTGGCGRLKYAVFSLLGLDLENFMEGIECENVSMDVVREYKMGINDPKIIHGGYDIRRHDGVIATIYNYCKKAPWLPFLEIVVWPDIDGDIESLYL